MVIRSQSAGNIDHSLKNINKPVEPQISSVVDSGSSVRKNLESVSQENKRVNQSKSSKKKQSKSALEILMEED